MEPYSQGYMNIEPVVIQPIENQEPSISGTHSNNIQYPLSTPAQSAVSSAGYPPAPRALGVHPHTGAVQYMSHGSTERQDSMPVLTPEPLNDSGFLNTGKALEYSWHTFDGQTMPAITPEKFIAVKIIERKILSFFPNTFPLVIRKRPPLRSIPMKPDEVNLLNSLNKHHKLGLGDFKEKDVMVKMSDFEEFYNAIKLYYPKCVMDLKSCANGTSGSRLGDTFGSGWVQINNTVLPFVKHGGNTFLPVDVIVNAAKLPVDVTMTAVLPARLYETLNEMCTILRKNIVFDEKTEVLPLHILEETAKSSIRFIRHLPSRDPKNCAKYIPDIDDTSDQSEQTNSIDIKDEVEAKPVFENTSSTNVESDKMETSNGEQIQKENLRPDSDNSDRTSEKSEGCLSNPTDKDTIKIETILCEGKTLQCLHRKEGTFVLMEALLRVFFVDLTLEHFAGGVEVVLGANIPECTPEEESAFILLYRIPKPSLKCKKLITTDHLEQNLSILRRMFQMAFHTVEPKKIDPAKSKTLQTQSDVICLD